MFQCRTAEFRQTLPGEGYAFFVLSAKMIRLFS
jgi:hypothetical protein